MSSDERHAAALDAITWREGKIREMLRIAQDTQLELEDPKLLGRHIPGWYMWPDVERVLAWVLDDLAGRRRIIQRHAPAWHVTSCQSACGSGWPCPDWRDAVLQEGQR